MEQESCIQRNTCLEVVAEERQVEYVQYVEHLLIRTIVLPGIDKRNRRLFALQMKVVFIVSWDMYSRSTQPVKPKAGPLLDSIL